MVDKELKQQLQEEAKHFKAVREAYLRTEFDSTSVSGHELYAFIEWRDRQQIIKYLRGIDHKLGLLDRSASQIHDKMRLDT